MDLKIFETGPIRPPFHANSLLLRITENCTWNRCNFCTLYRGGRFSMRSVEMIKSEIDNVAYYRDLILKKLLPNGEFDMEQINEEYSSIITPKERDCYAMVFNWIKTDSMENVFLQDANTMVLKPEVLGDIVSHLKKMLPEVKVVAAYGRVDTLAKITEDEFRMLKETGLNMIHSGYESGCNEVIKLLNKGCTSDQQIEAGKRVKKAGIEFNIFYMPGSGGKSLSRKNAVETAEVISEINPDFVRIRTFVVKPGSPMWQLQQEGAFEECSDIEKVLELKEMLCNVKNCDGYVISDHIINLLPRVEGYMNKDMDRIIKYIDGFLQLPEKQQRQFQLARRMCFGVDYNSMNYMPQSELAKLTSIEARIKDEAEWEELMRKYLRNYI